MGVSYTPDDERISATFVDTVTMKHLTVADELRILNSLCTKVIAFPL
jgi:hypothetical protein